MVEQLYEVGLVALAALLGAVVGFEREFAAKPAGLRTHMFVCAASAMLMLLGDSVVERFELNEGTISDPIRIIQAIVIGISFLGTGTIIHTQGAHVEGLTTAATILFASGIGISVASERFVFALGITCLAVAILFVIGWTERYFLGEKPRD